MTELTKAHLGANIQIMTQLNDTGLPDGAVLEYYNSCLDSWTKSRSQDMLANPYGGIYRITLPKPAPRNIIKQNAAKQDETLCNGVTLEEVSSVLIHAANVCFDNDFAYDMQPFGKKLVTIRDRLNGDVQRKETQS